MLDNLKRILEKVDGRQADFADIRYELKNEVKITFDGKELSQVAVSETDGYVLRILNKGGFSSLAFTREADAEKAIKTIFENVALIVELSGKPVSLANAHAVHDLFKPELIEDPRQVSLDEKLELTQHYNSIALDHPSIATTNISYLETLREKYYVNTEGAQIQEDLVTTSISGLITSHDGATMQNIRVAVGGSNGFAVLRNHDELFEKRKEIVLDLLKAKPVQAGVYNVILNNSMAGVFTHEAFGHFSEADIIEDNPTMLQKMQIGCRLGSDILNIVDDATIKHQLGFYKYDDEGIEVKPVQLLKDGILVGRLHSRRTAAQFGEPINGHCVAEDYRYAPIIRMGTIFIQPGKDGVDELFTKLGDGLYIIDAKGGQTGGEDFTFGAQYGYTIKNGRKTEMIRDVNISGNLYQTMQNITGIANDFVLSKTGGCGKGQINIRSCHGGPHILVRNLVIGGR